MKRESGAQAPLIFMDQGLRPPALPLRQRLMQRFLPSLIWVGVLCAIFFFAILVRRNLEAHNITTGFAFLGIPSGFEISETPIAYSSNSTFAWAMLVGVVNTLKASVTIIIAATILGLLLCAARFSSNPLVLAFANVLTEILRNVPPLLQLFVWYTLFYTLLPGPRAALNPLPGVLISSRGIRLPSLDPGIEWFFMIGLAILGAVATWLALNAIHALRARPVSGFWTLPLSLLGGGLVALAVATLIAGRPAVELPELRGLNIRGGYAISPEFAALTIGLSLYAAGHLSAIFRSAILAVPKGQWQAGEALGLHSFRTAQLIVFPQAMRIALPPLTSQWVNIIKNSSLAVAIGYPDLVAVGNTTISLTGQVIEVILIYILFYTSLNLSISALARHLFGKDAHVY